MTVRRGTTSGGIRQPISRSVIPFAFRASVSSFRVIEHEERPHNWNLANESDKVAQGLVQLLGDDAVHVRE